jgi:hypothetical protein
MLACSRLCLSTITAISLNNHYAKALSSIVEHAKFKPVIHLTGQELAECCHNGLSSRTNPFRINRESCLH